jgi:hypothetical protein
MTENVKIYINLFQIRTIRKIATSQCYIAPKNPNAPEGKNWSVGSKLPDGSWYNQAAFLSKDESGGLTL